MPKYLSEKHATALLPNSMIRFSLTYLLLLGVQLLLQSFRVVGAGALGLRDFRGDNASFTPLRLFEFPEAGAQLGEPVPPHVLFGVD